MNARVFFAAFLVTLQLAHGRRVNRNMDAIPSDDEDFSTYCSTHGGEVVNTFCRCDGHDKVCQKGVAHGCGENNEELSFFTKNEWRAGEDPKCVPPPCTTGTITYDAANSRWLCACTHPSLYCLDEGGGKHCPFDIGPGFPKLFSPTECESCACRIKATTKFWKDGRNDFDAMCKERNAQFDAKDSAVFGQLTCNCPEGMDTTWDGKSVESFDPLGCPECICMSEGESDETSIDPFESPEDVSYEECRACGLWATYDSVHRYLVQRDPTQRVADALKIRVFKNSKCRSGELPVQIEGRKFDAQLDAMHVNKADYGIFYMDQTALVYKGEFVYARSRHGFGAMTGPHSVKMTIQIFVAGNMPKETVLIKETREDGTDTGFAFPVVRLLPEEALVAGS